MANRENGEKKRTSFWETAPGMLTAIAALVTAIGSCVAIVLSNPRLLDLIVPPSLTPTPALVERTEQPPPTSVTITPIQITESPPLISSPTLTDTPTPTLTVLPTFTPLPTATALIDAYGGTWVYSGTSSGTLPFALYRLKIENVNSQNNTATFSACRCKQQETCQNKANLTPLLVSAQFEASKLVAEPVYIDQQRTVQWALKAIKVGQNLRVTVEQYKDNVKVAGPEDFVLNLPKITFPGGQAEVFDECQEPPVIYIP